MHLNRFKFHPLSSVLFLILIFSPTFVLAANPETYSATLVDFEGKVWFQKPDKGIWLPVQKYMALGEGDSIKTGSTGYVEILMDDGSLLALERESEITLKELSADFETKKIFSTVSLWFGRLLSNIHKFSDQKSKFEVQTSTAVAGVRGTEFIVETTDSERTEIGVFEGNVMVGGLDKSGKLIQGSEVLITNGNQTTILEGKLPLQPFSFQGRMLSYKKKMESLRKKAIDRRHDLPNIIRKRTRADEQVVKNRKKIGRTSLIIDEKNKQLKQNLASKLGEQNDIQLKKELDASWSGDGTKTYQRKEWINWYEHTNVVASGNIKGTFNPIDATSQLIVRNTPQNIMNPLITNIVKKTGDPESFNITGKGNDEVPIIHQRNTLGQKMKGDSSVAHPISLDHPTPAIQEPATNLIKIPGTAPSIPVNIQKLQIDALSSRIESMTEVNDNLVNK